MGVVGRGRQNSAVNHFVGGPDRHLDNPAQGRAPRRNLRSQLSKLGGRFGREVGGPAADFGQGVARQFVVCGRDPRVRKECDGFERTRDLRESKETKAGGQQHKATAGPISALEHTIAPPNPVRVKTSRA